MRLAALIVLLMVSAQAHAQQIPPYPPPLPEDYSSVDTYLYYANARLEQLSARERALSIIGREPHYTAKRAGAYAMGATGIGVFAVGFLTTAAGMLYGDMGGVTGGRVIVGSLGVGAGLLLGGLGWLIKLKRNNPYRDEIHDLHVERGLLKKQIKEARREPFTLSLQGLQLRF